MHRTGGIAASVLATIVAATPVLAATHKPKPQAAPPAHNFVNDDLTASVPAPQTIRPGIALIDTATARHDGDTITFERLTIWKAFGHYYSGGKEIGPPEGAILNTTTRYEASCRWHSYRELPGPLQNGLPMPGTQETFLEPGTPFLSVIDRLCEGQPLNAAKGFASAQAATAAWTENFSAITSMPPPTMMRRVRPTTDAWMDGSAPHRFVVVANDSASGNMLYLDRGTLVRDDHGVSGLTFAVLGSQAQYFGKSGLVAVLRRAQFDCAGHAMTVTAQAGWDQAGELITQARAAFPMRGISAKAELDAVCADTAMDTGGGFASTEAAWDDARAHWPPPPFETWASCLWAHMPDDRRTAYVAQWTGDIGNRFFATQSEATPALAACAVPDTHRGLALGLLTMYARQRAALHKLANRDIDEAKILAAWNAMPAADRRRLIARHASLSQDDIRAVVAMDTALADRLHIRDDSDARSWLCSYIFDLQVIEGGG